MEKIASIIDGKIKGSGNIMNIISPYDEKILCEVDIADEKIFNDAILSSLQGFKEMKKIPSWKRSEILNNIANGIEENASKFARAICLEAGKPISLSKLEVNRAVYTFRIASQEAKRIEGEVIDMEATRDGEKRIGILKRFPKGVLFAISPFNFPLNLVVHKIAPAIASGCSVVLKPASQTPSPSFLLAKIILESGAPEGAVNVVLCGGCVADKFVSDERFAHISFTGSSKVGWHLKKKAEKKGVTLELGGNAAAIVHKDADIHFAAKRLATGSFLYAGQICISVQRIFVQSEIYEKFKLLFLEETAKVKYGNPEDEEVICGPLIDYYNTNRIEEWLKSAVQNGGKLLTGGGREGNVIKPCVVEDCPHNEPLYCEEAFGPVVCIEKYNSIDDAIDKVNESKFGLQTGIFSSDISTIFRCYNEIDTAGVIHNDYPTFRLDPMPYGGMKESGMGREGPKYAIEELTEPKLLVLKTE